MKRKWLTITMASLLALSLMSGCGAKQEESTAESSSVESSMEESSVEESSSEAESSEEESTETEESTIERPEFASDEVTYDNVEEYVELGEYKNFTLVRDLTYAGEEIGVPKILEDLYDLYYIYPADTVIENGMTVAIDYVGRTDGVEFEGGTGSRNLVIGSGQFIEGFEEQLVGHTAGETVIVKLTFPEDYWNEEMAGKEAEFTVTIHAIVDEPWQMVLRDTNLIKEPTEMTAMWAEQVRAQYEEAAEGYELSVDEYKEAVGITLTEEESAAENVKNYLTALAIRKAEGITDDSELYKEMEAAVIEASGYVSREDVLADGISAMQMDITTSYYVAFKTVVDAAASIQEGF